MKKKGFTLIELLAVIIILGILMLIAIPSITKYINDSRKNSYINTAKELIKGATNFVNSGEVELLDENITYYIPSTCIKTENTARSPYGKFNPAYIIVTYDNENYNYYWMSRDEQGIGIKDVTHIDSLEPSLIKTDIPAEDMIPSTTIGNRNKILEIKDDCKTVENREVKTNIRENRVTPVRNCIFDGEMVQGAEFVDGQYTYKYKQNGTSSGFANIDIDGWGVVLTDKDSIDPVNTPLCTTINEKPIVATSYMFYNSKTSSIDTSSFDTRHVTNMSYMFYNASSIESLDVSNFDVNEVKVANVLFAGMTNMKTLVMDGWDLKDQSGNQRNFTAMFSGMPLLECLSLKYWVMPKNFNEFTGTLYLRNPGVKKIDVTGWDLSRTETIDFLFNNLVTLEEIIGLDTWDTSNITSMDSWFNNCIRLKNIEISNWDISNVTNLDYLFYKIGSTSGMGETNVKISNFVGPKVTTAKYMFNLLGSAADSVVLSVDNLKLPNATKISYMFEYVGNTSRGNVDISLKNMNFESALNDYSSGNGEMFNYLGYRAGGNAKFVVDGLNLKSFAYGSRVFSYMFEYAYTLDALINDVDLSGLTTLGDSFGHMGGHSKTANIVISNIDARNATSASDAFYCVGSSGESVTLKIINWNTPSLTSTYSMFRYVGQLTTKSYDVTISNLNTSNVTNMSSMFYTNGRDVTEKFHLKFENFDTSKVTNMSYFLNYSGEAAADFKIEGLENFDLRNVTSMSRAFYGNTHGSNPGIKDYGTLNIYATDISNIFGYTKNIKATINLYDNPTSYGWAFYEACTYPGSGITVNYKASVTNVDDVIATKSSSDNVVKGSIIP